MSANQDHSNQHILYQQQPSYNAYPSSAGSTMGTWGQPAPQAVPYAIPYHGEMNPSYPDKPQTYSGGYSMQFSGGDNEYYRYTNPANYAHPQQMQQIGQWQQQPTYQSYAQPVYTGFSNERDNSRTTFNPGAPPPNMNRPPPNVKRDNDAFPAVPDSLSMLDHSMQSAAYTASWVSSTSSIPPDLKDEPEFGLPSHRSDMNTDVFSSQNFTQFENLSLNDQKNCRSEIGHWENQQAGVPAQPQHWPGLNNQDDQSRHRKFDKDRRSRDEPRELTWEERLRKAQVQKERVERNATGTGIPDQKDRTEMNGRGSGNRSRGGFGGRGLRDSGRRSDNNQGQKDWRNEQNMAYDHNQDHHNSHKNSTSGRTRGMSNVRGPPYNAAVPPHAVTSMFPHGQQMMMAPRGGPFIRGGPPPHVLAMQQDERFKNTWLDANAFPQPFIPFAPVPFPMDARFGGRGRGRGGRGRGSGGYGRRERRDEERKEYHASESGEAVDQPTSNEQNVPTVNATNPTVESPAA